MKEIKEIIKLTKEKLNLVPELKKRGVVIVQDTHSEPIVVYTCENDGYYQTVEERGEKRINKVASTEDQMVIYFVDKYINDYALDYELKNRRRYEDHMRQVYEVKNRCWQYIDRSRMQKYINNERADNVARILDLIADYRNIAYDILQETRDIDKLLRDYCDYLVRKEYADTPNGGMNNISTGYKTARNAIEFIIKEYSKMDKANNDIIDDFKKLEPIHDKVVIE